MLKTSRRAGLALGALLCAASLLCAAPGAQATGSLTKTPASMVNGLADGTTTQQSATTGAVSVVGTPAAFINDYTGDGSTVAFTLSAAPGASAKVSAWIGGVYQNAPSFSLSGATLTFAAAPPSGVAIEVKVVP